MENKCLQRALRLLERRDYSRGELEHKLLEKQEPPEAVAQTLERLEAMHLINDARYAALVVRQYGQKAYGPARIRQEFQRRRIPRELWDAAMEEAETDEDKLQRLLQSKLRGKDLSDLAERRRAEGFLLRRGFSWDAVRTALARYRMEENNE